MAIFLAYVIWIALRKDRSNFPPGPTGLPVVGYLPFLTKDVHLDLIKLGKKYGDVFSIKLGAQNLVILNGYDAIVEALNKTDFLGRPSNGTLQKINPSSAFFGKNFSLWNEQRKPVIKILKDLGLGKTNIEGNILDEINSFLARLKNSESKPIDIKEPLSSSISNIISSLVFGKRFECDDPKRHLLRKDLKEYIENFRHFTLDGFFPCIEYIPFAIKFLHCNKSMTARKSLELFCQKELKEHSKTINTDHARDFIDRYLMEIDRQSAKHPDSSFNRHMLIQNAIDMFTAGTETVESTLLWFIYAIAAFPNVQKKVQEEIMEVIGAAKTVDYLYMKNMPYTRAVMLEIMRWKGVIPLSLAHTAVSDTTVGGYKLPKGASVVANLWAVHHDPRHWDEPQKFKPERFLAKDGRSVVKPSFFMPFLVGKRACPGESMAYRELFLYITSILREFDVAFPNETEPTFDSQLCITNQPKPYLVRFIPRK